MCLERKNITWLLVFAVMLVTAFALLISMDEV
jgi:hypothetical protein